MIKINTEGAEFYLALAEDISRLEELDLGLPCSILEFYNSKNKRIAFFENLLDRGKCIPRILVWQEEVNFKELELKVINNQYSDEDFLYAYRTDYKKLECSDCKTQVGAFVVDAGEPYPFNDALTSQKIKSVTLQSCPVCNQSLRQLVVELW